VPQLARCLQRAHALPAQPHPATDISLRRVAKPMPDVCSTGTASLAQLGRRGERRVFVDQGLADLILSILVLVPKTSLVLPTKNTRS
jgi:hypothetical protein